MIFCRAELLNESEKRDFRHISVEIITSNRKAVMGGTM